ncbi:flagellar hook assembly protein FlgD [Sphingomonas sp.]|uniref:flagellar hook assembly protein FlgD n=1 Tax=Sphingomonas sp. TaxID=28214 RepID=UPI0035BC5FB2
MTVSTAATSFDTTLSNLGIKRNSTSPTVAASASTTLGQSDFLKLMTAQMQNQDPFNPVDNTQMVAQMAQFSSLAGISEMSSTLKGISDKLGTTSVSDASSYIGRTVLTAGDTAYGRTTGGLSGAVELSGAASDVKVTIESESGAVVKQISLGASPKGTSTYDWDGLTAAGEDAGSGPFKITVTAQNNGATVPATGLVWAPVQSVSVPPGGSPVLNVAGIGTVQVSAVREIG